MAWFSSPSGRRVLQATVALLSLVPILAGGAGMLLGPAFLTPVGGAGVELDSHVRYLSGLLLAIGLVFASTVPAIERRTARFRLAGAVVVVGGLGRLVSLGLAGVPAWPHVAGLVLELIVVPLLMLWQAAVARSAT